MKGSEKISRRNIMKTGLGMFAALPAIEIVGAASVTDNSLDKKFTKVEKSQDPWRGLKIGVATFSFLQFPTETAIANVRKLDLKYVSIKDKHLPMTASSEERKTLAKKFIDGGVTPLSCGNMNVSKTPTEEEFRRIFQYAKDIGVPTIVTQPPPEYIPLLDKLVKEFDIKVALHNHGPNRVYPTPYEAMAKAKGYDKRIGVCIDIGHTARCGVDPAKAVIDFGDRVYDMHLKDVTSPKEEGQAIEVGRGIIDIQAVLKALITIKYAHLAAFEHEINMEDPMPGLGESVGYIRALLSQI
jgi:inosose dehydratase